MSEIMDPEILDEVTKALKVPAEAFKRLDGRQRS